MIIQKTNPSARLRKGAPLVSAVCDALRGPRTGVAAREGACRLLRALAQNDLRPYKPTCLYASDLPTGRPAGHAASRRGGRRSLLRESPVHGAS